MVISRETRVPSFHRSDRDRAPTLLGRASAQLDDRKRLQLLQPTIHNGYVEADRYI